MSNRTKRLFGLSILVALGILLAACQGATQVVPPTQGPRATDTAAPQVEPTAPSAQPTEAGPAESDLNVPFVEAWQGSAHADAEAEAFTHWNEEDPAEIPAECAKCHSTPGFQDYVGADGSAAFEVNTAHEVGSVVTCEACHNQATAGLSTVRFPSGAELTGVGEDAVCLTCHQGTASKVQVDENIAAAGVTDNLDEPVEDLGFTNIHYYAAAVSRYGTQVKGGYEYDGKTYDVLFEHAAGVDNCQDCHDPHSLEVKTQLCAECHDGADSIETIRQIRMASSLVDYDGDGSMEEGIADEIAGLREMLYTAIQSYAADVAGTPLAYTSDAYPYFFVDTNSNGTADADEAMFPNQYNAWTARLAKAAYNYQTSLKDPGAYVHGGKYIIQLLYDSIEDMNTQLGTQVDLSNAHREDPGHFAGSTEAWRHWDAEGEVPGNCAKCHSAEGLPMFLANNATIAVHPSNGMLCETCHSNLQDFARYTVERVTFPSGATVSLGEGAESNLCLHCHQGRESTVSVNRVIGNLGDNEVSETLRFRNVHYFAAGATLFGTEVKGAYEYDGQQYSGRFMHVEGFQTCDQCHDAHALTVNSQACLGCHTGTESVEEIRAPGDTTDYDGDGNTDEGIAGEIDTMRQALYEALQAYAETTLQAPIVYDPVSHPYFFNDTNGNGEPDADEINGENQFASWSPRLLRAAYNYQYSTKDPGAAAHNGNYIMQVLYDSLQDVGGASTVQGMTRPELRQTAEPQQ